MAVLRVPLETPLETMICLLISTRALPFSGFWLTWALVKNNPSVDHQNLSSYRLSAAKQQDLVSNILEAGMTLECGALPKFIDSLFRYPLEHGSAFHQSGGNTIDGYVGSQRDR